MFGQRWINAAQFEQSAQYGHARKLFMYENLLEGVGMPLPRERLGQDFEQGSHFYFNDLSMQRKSSGQRPGFPLVNS